MGDYGKIILKSGKDQSLMRYHPWVFSGAIKKTKGSFQEGDVVKVYNNKDQFLGLGHYQPGTIAVRVFSFDDVPVDEEFWKERLAKALELRKMLGFLRHRETNVFRLVNAEGDGLPGLVIDYYNGTAVIQAHSVGMYRPLQLFTGMLRELLGERLQSVYNKSSASLPHKASIEREEGYLWGRPLHHTVMEHGLVFRVNWSEGQKTGFYVDQRENRDLLRYYARNARVLNLFGYTGGFSVYAAAAGCRSVVTVDSSQKAIALAAENMRLNFEHGADHEGVVRDAFEYLHQYGDRFDLMVLDPPAFAKHYNVLPNAIQGYKKLNRLAIGKIQPGGIIFTFSCSQVMSRENFRKMAFTAAANTGRKVRVLGQMSQPPDHPVDIYHPEGEYLKGLVLQVL
jgi:23S rRNA (cytosine1962-C5)-methyltransferase